MEVVFLRVVNLYFMRYTLLSEIHDTTFRPVHNQSLFRKIEVDIHLFPFIIKEAESHYLRFSGGNFQCQFISTIIISQ